MDSSLFTISPALESGMLTQHIFLLMMDQLFSKIRYVKYRGSYMSANVLLNLLTELRKRDKMRGLPSSLSFFRNEFNEFNKT